MKECLLLSLLVCSCVSSYCLLASAASGRDFYGLHEDIEFHKKHSIFKSLDLEPGNDSLCCFYAYPRCWCPENIDIFDYRTPMFVIGNELKSAFKDWNIYCINSSHKSGNSAKTQVNIPVVCLIPCLPIAEAVIVTCYQRLHVSNAYGFICFLKSDGPKLTTETKQEECTLHHTRINMSGKQNLTGGTMHHRKDFLLKQICSFNDQQLYLGPGIKKCDKTQRLQREVSFSISQPKFSFILRREQKGIFLSPHFLLSRDKFIIQKSLFPDPLSEKTKIKCIIQPTVGFVFETTFLFTCTPDWENIEKFKLEVYFDDEMNEEILEEYEWTRPKGRLVHVLPDFGMYNLKFPKGNPAKNYSAIIRVDAVSVFGKSYSFIFSPVQVYPPSQCIPFTESDLTQASHTEPFFKETHNALAFVTILSSYINSQAFQKCQKGITDKKLIFLVRLLQIVDKCTLKTATQFHHAADAVKSIVEDSISTLQFRWQAMVAELYSQWSLSLSEPGRRTSEEIFTNKWYHNHARMEAAVALINSLTKIHRSAVIQTANTSETNIKPRDVMHKCLNTAYISRSLVSAMDSVNQAIINFMDTSSVRLKFGDYTVFLKIPGGRHIKLGGPNDTMVVIPDRNNSARCIVSSMNPFPCLGQTKLLNTHFVMIKVPESEFRKTKINKIELYLRKTKDIPSTNVTAKYVNATEGYITIHKVQVPENNTDVLIEVTAKQALRFLKIVLKMNIEPTSKDFGRKWVSREWVNNKTIIHVKTNGTLYIGVTPKLNLYPSATKMAVFKKQKYKLSTYLVTCRTWNHLKWTIEGCYVGRSTSSETLHCSCTHLSWFSGGNMIVPNEITWRKVSKGVRENNFLVMSCVIAIWVIYGLVLLWARRADQRDEVYNTVMDLHQNVPTDQQPYIVTIITGFRRNAGTTSKVWLKLVGREGSSRMFLLKDSSVNPNTLQRKSEDYFLATTEKSLGEILEVVFTLEPKHNRPAWFLHTVVVQDMLEDLVWVFFVEDWLRPDPGSESKSFHFYPASSQQQADFWTLFRRRLQRHFFTGHTWFNVIARYRSSKFTRAQRVTCALFVILSAMMFNIMYHGVDTTVDSEEFNLVQFTVHVNEIILGLQVSLVTVPLGVFVVFVFTNCRPRPMLDNHQQNFPVTMDSDRRISLFSYLDNLSQNSIESPDHTEYRTQILQEYARMIRDGRRGLLPWWFQWVGWVVALLGSVIFSAIINLYGFTYGNKKSTEWLITTLTTLLHNEIILEPLKVIIISSVLARLIPRPPEVDDYSIRNTISEQIPDDLKP